MEITLLHYYSVPETNGEEMWFEYTAFILHSIMPRKIEFTSYLPLDEDEVKEKILFQLKATA